VCVLRSFGVAPVNHWVILTRECESSEPESPAGGRNPDGCTRHPRRRFQNREQTGPPKTSPTARRTIGVDGFASDRLSAGNPLTTGALDFTCLKFGSSGRIRTYNPSVNSRTACFRLVLQTQILTRAKNGFSGKLGGLWGCSGEPAYSRPLRHRFPSRFGQLAMPFRSTNRACGSLSSFARTL
jgi:hypothetical protein